MASPIASRATQRSRGAPRNVLGSRNPSDWHQTQDFVGLPQAWHGVLEGFICGNHHSKTWRSRGRGGPRRSRRGGYDDRLDRPIADSRPQSRFSAELLQSYERTEVETMHCGPITIFPKQCEVQRKNCRFRRRDRYLRPPCDLHLVTGRSRGLLERQN